MPPAEFAETIIGDIRLHHEAVAALKNATHQVLGRPTRLHQLANAYHRLVVVTGPCADRTAVLREAVSARKVPIVLLDPDGEPCSKSIRRTT